MARGEQILRHWNMLRTLQTRGEGIPLRQLAEEFDVTERTVQRDFEILQESGFPIEHEEDDYGKRFWRMPHDFFRTGTLVLGLTEAVSLHLAHRLFTPLAGTHFEEGMQSILDKVRSLIPRNALEYFADLDEILYVRRTGVTDYSAHTDTIRELTDATRAERTLEVSYRALWSRKAYTTRFDPYGLVLYDGDLFLIGRSHRADDIRLFKVSRIDAALVTEEGFKRPDDFCLEGQFRSSFGIVQSAGEPVDIEVKLTGAAAGLVEERVWHESQKLAWLDAEATLFDEAPDEPEALIATFRLANLVEFKRWIKGFGDQAEVLRPDWLRSEMRAELLAAAGRYDG